MSTRLQVSCINESGRPGAHERIANIGGLDANGNRYKLTEEDAIRGIESGTHEFFVSQGGETAEVIVASRLGKKYLKTRADGEAPDNLLSLPECP